VFFNKKAYNDLPKHFQRVLDIAAADINVRTLAAFDAQSGAALDTLVKEHQVDVQVYPEDVLKQLKIISRRVIEEEAQKDPFTLKIHEDYTAFQAKTAVWGKMSEKVYWNTMA
jgi:TRAP-type mannitol/chloroaromatic compound transport system substrate-binding protein